MQDAAEMMLGMMLVPSALPQMKMGICLYLSLFFYSFYFFSLLTSRKNRLLSQLIRVLSKCISGQGNLAHLKQMHPDNFLIMSLLIFFFFLFLRLIFVSPSSLRMTVPWNLTHLSFLQMNFPMEMLVPHLRLPFTLK